jgi:hypothetical protein
MRTEVVKRAATGAVVGAAVGSFCILLGAIRVFVFRATGGHVAPLNADEIRLFTFYVVGFIIAGILLGAIWPLLAGRLAQYVGFSLAGIVVMIGILAGDKGGLVARTPRDWFGGISLGIIFGCAFAYGFRRRSAA